jgi:glycosyltransferase involved in cell wall biosynthesis
MPAIRILHLITSLDTGGAEMTLARLVGGMDRQKFESRVVSLIPIGDVGEKIKAMGIPVETLSMKPGIPSIQSLKTLAKILKTYNPDILQTWLYHADLLGLLVGRLAGVPAIAWNIRSSDMDFSKYRRLSGLVARLCALLSWIPQTIVVNSKIGMEHHINIGYHARSWQIIPNGIDTNTFKPDQTSRRQFRKKFNIPNHTTLVGLVGRLDPMKDHPNFIMAAANIQKHFNPAKFICVGDGPSEYKQSLQKMARKCGIDIIWAGKQEHMPAVYNALDILVLSSKFGEGFPNAVAEAMACGLPCVATNVGDAAYIIGNTGKIIPAGNPESLASALLSLLELPITQRQSMGLRARHRIESNFSLEKMLDAYEILYENLTMKQ